jgi:hypothetical protein
MRRLLAAAGAACLAVACAALGAGAGPARAQGAAAVPDFPLAEVRPGLVGYGLTAGPGGEVERFDVEVLAVQEDAGPGFPLVLVRASGTFIEAAGGVAAGMSGSPVYLPRDGRDALLGAIGYVFPEADHDLALVTPIGAMRDVDVAGAPTSLAVPGLGTAVPVTTPVLMTGTSPRAAALLDELFAGAPTRPFAPLGAQGSANGGAEPAAPPELAPGAAVAVQLIGGDLQLAALGTVTAVEDGSLLALGHPLFGAGRASYGLAPADVTAVVPSDVVPFKLANVRPETVGAVTHDTPAALVGEVGREPETVDLALTVTVSGRSERFAVRLAAGERLYPLLAAIATLDAADRVLRSVGPGKADLAWEVTLRDGTRVRVLEQVTSEEDVGLEAARLAGEPLAVLAGNRFADPQVESVDLSVAFDRDPGSAEVAEVVLEDEKLVAGGHAILHVRLQPYRREAVVRTFSVPLPTDLNGEVTLLVRGGDVPREIEGAPEEGGEVDEPRTFPELLDALRDQVQASELVVESVDEHGDVRRLLRVPLAWVVVGSQDLHVTVAPADEDGSGGDGPGQGEEEDR